MKSQKATEQLLLSKAVDESVSRLDFRILAGRTVYLDTRFVKSIKGAGFVNADYIISSLRQQMFAAECQVMEKLEDADYVVEARVGALGADAHSVTYGVPASNAFSTAATLVTSAPVVPPIPEIAFAKRNDNSAAAKVAVFAYHRVTKTPIFQSGMAASRSRAKDFWLFGVGPFQQGSIYETTQFAGEDLPIPMITNGESKKDKDEGIVDYFGRKLFSESIANVGDDTGIRQAGFDEGVDGDEKKNLITDDSPAADTPQAQQKAD